MKQQQWTTPVLAIADDFTGANDAGSGLARAGARVHVLFNSDAPVEPGAADVWVISTDSRALSAAEAAKRTTQAVRQHQNLAMRGWLFKKIDSTLRGNPGAEIAAALQAAGKSLALVVPAVPKLGRTTRHGEVLINGRLLTETEFASDPKTPVLSASVLAALQAQSDLPGAVLDLAALHAPGLAARLAGKQGFLVVDAQSDEDIACLMAAAAGLEEKPLLAGAAGLSDALGAWLSTRRPRPVLAMVGSMSAIAQQQIDRLAQQRRVTLVDIDIRQLFSQPAWRDRALWFEQALDALRRGEHTVIRTCQHAGQRHEIAALCEQHQLSRQQLGEQICQLLGELAQAICQRAEPAGLYLSGGDVAIAVAKALGASGFQIQGLIAGCVPHGFLLNSHSHLPVMTKAGGFGDENTLVEAIRFIEEMSNE